MNIKLNSNDRLLIVQFDLNNYEALPFRIPDLGKETKREAEQRRARSKINAVSHRLAEIGQKKIFAGYIPVSLYGDGYVLVNTEYRQRVDQKRKDEFFHSIRYTFVRKEFERKDDDGLVEFIPWRGIHYAGLQELCTLALWEKIRVFRNPFFENGIEKSGQYAISVNLDGRKPLFEASKSAATFVPEMKPDCLLVVTKSSLNLEPFSG